MPPYDHPPALNNSVTPGTVTYNALLKESTFISFFPWPPDSKTTLTTTAHFPTLLKSFQALAMNPKFSKNSFHHYFSLPQGTCCTGLHQVLTANQTECYLPHITPPDLHVGSLMTPNPFTVKMATVILARMLQNHHSSVSPNANCQTNALKTSFFPFSLSHFINLIWFPQQRSAKTGSFPTILPNQTITDFST